MDKFEKQIQDALNNYEAPYDASHWSSLNKKMGTPKSNLYKWIGGTAAILAITFGVYYLTADKTINQQSIATHKKEVNHTKVTSENTNTTKNQTVGDDSNTPLNDELNQQEHSNNTSEEFVDQNETITSNDNHNEIPNQLNNQNDEVINVVSHPNVEGDSNSEKQGSVSPELATAEVVVDATAKCLNETFEISPSVPKQKAIYEWDLGDGTIVTSNYVYHKYSKPGVYSITLTLKDKKSKEIIKASEPIEITVYNTPQSNFTYEMSDGFMPTVLFKNKTDNVNSNWEIVGVATSNQNNFEHTFKQKGKYVVRLTTTDDNQCSSTSTQVVSIDKDYNLLAPNAFSPNGDNLNDFFIPKALPLLNSPFTMLIYDRQGNLIFETKDANKPWDGINFRNGTPASDGVYVWVVQLTNEKGQIETYQGQVTIAR